MNLPPQKKWQIYCSRKGGEDTVDQTHAPEHYVERLHTLATVSIQYYRLLEYNKLIPHRSREKNYKIINNIEGNI